VVEWSAIGTLVASPALAKLGRGTLDLVRVGHPPRTMAVWGEKVSSRYIVSSPNAPLTKSGEERSLLAIFWESGSASRIQQYPGHCEWN
jgi:hypothetical protein